MKDQWDIDGRTCPPGLSLRVTAPPAPRKPSSLGMNAHATAALRAAVAAPERIAAVDRLWSTARVGEPELQAVVQMLQRVHGVPRTAISIVTTDRQTFLVAEGLAVSATETPDELAFCAYVAASGQPLLVVDALEHATFSQNPLVRAGRIGSYAGVPVRDEDGVVLGSLCLIGDSPGQVSAESVATLLEQVGVVAALLRACRQNVELTQALTARDAASRLVSTQARVLEGIARGESLESTLTTLALEVESSAPGALCSILVLDEDGATLRHGAGPSLPDDYVRAIDGTTIGPMVGSCGAAAATGLPAYAVDIATDPRWRPYRDFALAHGLRACWSMPVLGAGDTVLGTFAIYYGVPRGPQPEHVRLVQAWADLASIAIDRAAAARRLEHLALHDPVTGLPNRTALQQRLGSPEPGGRTVLFIDLDDFKLVNDGFGHATGDAVLVAVAERLRGVLPKRAGLYRFGGDEFVGVGSWNASSAEALAERLLAAVRAPVSVDGRELQVTASIGISVVPCGGSAEEGLSAADAAMFFAKGQGRDGWSLHDAASGVAARDRIQLTADLREAIARQELVVHYQPVVDLRTRDVVGVEALVRWSHPEHGMVPPSTFVPLAESANLVGALGKQVLRRACADIAAQSRLALSVNVSAHQLVDSTLPAMVASALAESGLAADRLWLEITETAVMTDPTRARATLLALAELGVRLSVDDFGTGHASLAYLKDLPVHELKIDRSFVSGLPDDDGDRAIVSAVIALSAAFGLSIVAEGVETEEQAQALVELGCTQAQGFLFARPAPLAELPPQSPRSGSNGRPAHYK